MFLFLALRAHPLAPNRSVLMGHSKWGKGSYAQQLLFVFIPKVEIPHAVILIPRFVEVVLLGRGFTSIDIYRTNVHAWISITKITYDDDYQTWLYIYLFFIASLFVLSFKDYIVLMILVHTHHK